MTIKEEYLNTIAKHQAVIDKLVEDNADDVALIIRDVLYNTESHDVQLFESLGIDPETTIDDYSVVPIYERDLTWLGGLSALFYAAQLTAWLEVFGVEFLALVEATEKKKRRLASQMSVKELKTAGVEGVSKERLKGFKAASDG